MQAILTVLLLVALLVVSTRVVFAADESDEAEYDSFEAPDLIQTEPINLGWLGGPEKAPRWPHLDLMEDSRGQ